MNDIPNFTPPTPTFEPPRGAQNPCHFHKNEEAVAKCAKCGKPICQDCADNYKVKTGKYAGKALCYDCCKELVEDNVADLKANKAKILVHFIATIIGMIVMGIIFASVPELKEYTVAGVFIGGCFFIFARNLLVRFNNWVVQKLPSFNNPNNVGWDLFKLIFLLIVGTAACVVIEVVCAIFRTIKKIIVDITYLIKTSSFIKSDSDALRAMEDYMQYTLVRNRNVGVDLSSLMAEGGELYNNSYARNVAQNGEEAAENTIREYVTSINENGEIIRAYSA